MTEQLHTLLVNGYSDSHRILKEKWTPELDREYAHDRGNHLIHDAVVNGKVEIVEFLLDKGIDPNVRLPGDYTPLMSGWFSDPASRKRCHMLLLKRGGNPFITNVYGQNAFSRAVQWPSHLKYLESYLMVELVCGEADNLSLDLWRVIKPFIYKL